MWEEYLLRYGSFAPGHVDRVADFIEHISSDKIRAELRESLLNDIDANEISKLPSIHPLNAERELE